MNATPEPLVAPTFQFRAINVPDRFACLVRDTLLGREGVTVECVVAGRYADLTVSSRDPAIAAGVSRAVLEIVNRLLVKIHAGMN